MQPGDFSFTVGDTGAGGSSAASSPSAASTGAGAQLSGSVQTDSLIAVGTMTADGQMIPFSSAQVQSEEAMAANVGQLSYADSLQNFLTLAQAGSPDGQVSASSYKDSQQFTGDNGLIGVASFANYSLSPTGDDAQQGSSSQSITA
jgi:hypothetical protein